MLCKLLIISGYTSSKIIDKSKSSVTMQNPTKLQALAFFSLFNYNWLQSYRVTLIFGKTHEAKNYFTCDFSHIKLIGFLAFIVATVTTKNGIELIKG